MFEELATHRARGMVAWALVAWSTTLIKTLPWKSLV